MIRHQYSGYPIIFGNQSTEPLRSMKATICFYPVADILQPDWEKCREMLKTKPPNFFTLVHYFGRVGDAGSARKFCDEAGALLIEDAAHVLKPEGEIGFFGDFTIYSPYKFLLYPMEAY